MTVKSEMKMIKSLFRFINKSEIRDFTNRLNYSYTPLLFVFCAAVNGIRYLYGNSIECTMPAEYPTTWNNHVNEFCYSLSTNYTLADHSFMVLQNHQMTDSLKDMKHLSFNQHFYIQWIPFILVVQALLIFLPSLLWKFIEQNQRVDEKDVVSTAKHLSTVVGDERKNGVKNIAIYLKQCLKQNYDSKNGNFNFGAKTSIYRICIKMLTVIVILAQLSFLNKIIENNSFWSISVIKSLESIFLNENVIFPRNFLCEFTAPLLSSKYPIRSIDCILTGSEMNEKMFAFIYLWLAATLMFSFMNLLYTFATLILSTWRQKTMKNYVQLKSASDTTLMHDEKQMHISTVTLGADGIHLFKSIKIHAGSIIANEIAAALFNDQENIFAANNNF